jgi:rod shape-determining protein MreC
MITLLRFLLKHYFVIFFIILESVAVSFLVRDNPYQNTVFANFALNFNGYLSSSYDDLDQYFFLKEKNEFLMRENEQLKNQLVKKSAMVKEKMIDSMLLQYSFAAAKVINNSTSNPYNYIMLNRGSMDGIKPEMAVISADGVVGIVHQASEHFAQVISLLNQKLKVSCKFKKNQYFGSLEWAGRNHRICDLRNIPLHLDVAVGDTIVTTGYGVFPEGILVGFVSDVKKGNSNFYQIEVRLSNDFRKLDYVYVVKDIHKEEKEQLGKQILQ